MKYTVILLAVLQIFLVVSCGSTPPPPATAVPGQPAPPPPPQPAGPSQAAQDALKTAAARAEAARKRASDFECPAYFPSDWEALESQYTAAGALPTSSDAELGQAAAAFNASADAYDSLFDKAIPLYAQAREDEIMAARNELIATGLNGEFPEYLRAADETALQAQSQYEANDYYAARDTAALALGTYQGMKTAADAYLARQEIVDRNFTAYDSENFNKADEIALAAVAAFKAGDNDAARDGAEEALLRYNLVLSAGWAGYAAGCRASAASARAKALDLKANVAVKDTFGSADVFFSQGETSLKAEKYNDAAAQYAKSESGFTAASQSALEKRRIAEQTITEAQKKIEASDEAAKQAEIIIEGGSK